jgi:hypothetical protein
MDMCKADKREIKDFLKKCHSQEARQKASSNKGWMTLPPFTLI